MTFIFILVGFVWLLIVYVHICPSTLIFLLISITVTKIKCLRWHKKLFDCYINAEPLEEEKEEEEDTPATQKWSVSVGIGSAVGSAALLIGVIVIVVCIRRKRARYILSHNYALSSGTKFLNLDSEMSNY